MLCGALGVRRVRRCGLTYVLRVRRGCSRTNLATPNGADSQPITIRGEDLLASDREDGVLGAGVTRFAHDADQRLIEIATELTSSTYQPSKFTPVALPRSDERTRPLHIPPVRDRVVERAVLAVLTPVIDP